MRPHSEATRAEFTPKCSFCGHGNANHSCDTCPEFLNGRNVSGTPDAPMPTGELHHCMDSLEVNTSEESGYSLVEVTLTNFHDDSPVPAHRSQAQLRRAGRVGEAGGVLLSIDEISRYINLLYVERRKIIDP